MPRPPQRPRAGSAAGAIIGPPTLVNAIGDALAPFGEVPLDLPLSPSKLLSVIEGRPIAARSAKPVRADTRDFDEASGTAVASKAAEAPVEAGNAPAPAGVIIDGKWKIVLATPVGPQPMIGRFTTEGNVLKGVLEADMGSQEFEGTVSGNTLKWDLKVTKPMSPTLKYDVEIHGDSLTGKVKMGFFGTAKLTGERL